MEDIYEVRVTRYAYHQMKEIRQYIEYELMSPAAAKNLLGFIRDEIGTLRTMPSRHSLVRKRKWREAGVRRLIVKNFNIYYWIDEEKKTVHITAVVYAKRDQLKQLNAMCKE